MPLCTECETPFEHGKGRGRPRTTCSPACARDRKLRLQAEKRRQVDPDIGSPERKDNQLQGLKARRYEHLIQRQEHRAIADLHYAGLMPEDDGLVPTQGQYDGDPHDPLDDMTEGMFWEGLPDEKVRHGSISKSRGFKYFVRWVAKPDHRWPGHSSVEAEFSPPSLLWELPWENVQPATRTPKRYTPRKGWDTVSRAPQPWEAITPTQYADPGRKESRKRMSNEEIALRIDALQQDHERLEQLVYAYVEDAVRSGQRLREQMPSNIEISRAVDDLIQVTARI